MTAGDALEKEVEFLTPIEGAVLARYRRIRALLDECLAMGFDLDKALEQYSDDQQGAQWMIMAALELEKPPRPQADSEEE